MSFRDLYQGTWQTNPFLAEIIEKTPKNYIIIPLDTMAGFVSISNIISEQEHKGYELKAYIESPIPHGAHSIPSLLIFKEDSFPILMEEICKLQNIMADKWYKRFLKKLKSFFRGR